MMRPTPGFLRGQAVTAAIKAMHDGTNGTWHLVECEQLDIYASMLTFAVGWIDPETLADERPRVRITVAEDSR